MWPDSLNLKVDNIEGTLLELELSLYQIIKNNWILATIEIGCKHPLDSKLYEYKT